MTDFKHVEEQIAGLRCSGSVLPVCTAENIADTMQALLDVAKAAESVIECHASTGIPQKNQSMATVQAERHSRLMQLHLALAKLQDQDDESR
jgi:hypothetical protein